jgi:hypothetical protein
MLGLGPEVCTPLKPRNLQLRRMMRDSLAMLYKYGFGDENRAFSEISGGGIR